MDIEIYEKPVMTKFVVIDGEEFECYKLLACLEQINETEKCSLRDYELLDYEITKKLVKMGLVCNYTGSRMADLYCMKNKKDIEDLIDTLYELND